MSEDTRRLLAKAEAAGVLVWLDGVRVRLRSRTPPPAPLLAELQAHKGELIAALHPEYGLPDPCTAPLGKCRRCPFTAPLNLAGLCGCCASREAWS